MTAQLNSRIETDSLGPREVPPNVLWGVSTLRALENFPVSGRPIGSLRNLVWALGAVKHAAAGANTSLGLLDTTRAEAIRAATREVMDGQWDEEFVVDRIQGGAGTSTNMNANEVVANRALQLLGHPVGTYAELDPIDHVNRCQSTNDAYPTAVKLALHRTLTDLLDEHARLEEALRVKAGEFASFLKIGRTQLQDAVPMTLGQEFKAFADTIGEDRARLAEAMPHLLEVNLGATAIGTGINAPAGYREAVIRELATTTGLPVASPANLVEATSDTGVFLLISGMLKRAAVKLSKVCNDLRLLSSGPQSGFGEIQLPSVQAGSSIMPGKVNPVIPEMVNQIAFRVVGADTTVTMAVEAGQLQLNAFEPVMADALLESIDWLTRGCRILRERCIEGISANQDFLQERVASSLAVATALTPYLGYAVSAALIKEALSTRRSLAELVLEQGLLDTASLADALAPERLTGEMTVS